MNLVVLPKTRSGKWSTWLIVSLLVMLAVFFILVATGQRGGDTFFSNLALSIPMLIAGISGIAAFFTGIVGIIFKRERSFMVIFATIIGLFVLFFAVAELIYPH